MVDRGWRTNSWSIPLVLAGIAFTLTASAYAVMAVKKLDASLANPGAGASPWLIDFLDRHGAGLMFVELVVLAAVAVAAMGTERWRTVRRDIQTDEDWDQNQRQG
jgi:hypothetical protein